MVGGMLGFYPQYFAHSNLIQVSPTLELVNDCLKFVVSFFEPISTSAPHIYHSALLLSPQTSIVKQLYKPYNNPLVRFVHGVPISWDVNTAAINYTKEIRPIAWSPCNKFIAVAPSSPGRIQILDAVTLEQLFTTSSVPWTEGNLLSLVFSPDSSLLTLFLYDPHYVITWNLQTGGIIGDIKTDKDLGSGKTMIYSECGTMVGALFRKFHSCTICTYDIPTATSTASHSIKGWVLEIWTHGKYLQLAAVEQSSITIWETEFTSRQPPTCVQSLSIPENFDPTSIGPLDPSLYHHATFCLAFILPGAVLIWNAQDSKFLLNSSVNTELYPIISFSPSGYLFAYQTAARTAIYIWKKSLNGYVPYQQLSPNITPINSLLFSPNGKSLLALCQSTTIQLWHMEVPATSTSNFSTNISQWWIDNHIVEFSPDEGLVAVTQPGNKGIIVLDPKLNIPKLTINVDAIIYATRIFENKIFVVCSGSIFTWDIPRKRRISDGTVNVSDAARTVTFNHQDQLRTGLISPNFQYIATVTDSTESPPFLEVYDTSTGKRLGNTPAYVTTIWFTPDSNEIWDSSPVGFTGRWKIVKDKESNWLEDQVRHENPPGGFPWESAHGYRVTDNGWILSPSGKQLLWLPHHWWVDEKSRRWSGPYLALLHHALSEAVILDLSEE